METTSKRGSLVFARCYGGKVAVLKVWSEDENIVLLSDPRQFDRLQHGLDALSPVGFPKSDVFEYDERIAKDTGDLKIKWESLKPYADLSRQE